MPATTMPAFAPASSVRQCTLPSWVSPGGFRSRRWRNQLHRTTVCEGQRHHQLAIQEPLEAPDARRTVGSKQGRFPPTEVAAKTMCPQHYIAQGVPPRTTALAGAAPCAPCKPSTHARICTCTAIVSQAHMRPTAPSTACTRNVRHACPRTEACGELQSRRSEATPLHTRYIHHLLGTGASGTQAPCYTQSHGDSSLHRPTTTNPRQDR